MLIFTCLLDISLDVTDHVQNQNPDIPTQTFRSLRSSLSKTDQSTQARHVGHHHLLLLPTFNQLLTRPVNSNSVSFRSAPSFCLHCCNSSLCISHIYTDLHLSHGAHTVSFPGPPPKRMQGLNLMEKNMSFGIQHSYTLCASHTSQLAWPPGWHTLSNMVPATFFLPSRLSWPCQFSATMPSSVNMPHTSPAVPMALLTHHKCQFLYWYSPLNCVIPEGGDLSQAS